MLEPVSNLRHGVEKEIRAKPCSAGRPTQALQRYDEVARQSRILPQRLLQRAADSERLELQARHRNLVDRIGDQLLLFTEIDLRRANGRPERRDRAECCSGARQSVLAAAQQLHGSNKVTASHDRIFDGNVRLEELGRPIEQRLTVACQLLNVLSGELKADVAAATSSAVDSSHGNHLLGRDSRYDKGKSPKSSRIIARENTFLKYILPSRCTYGICYTDILHKISVVGYNQDASIIVF